MKNDGYLMVDKYSYGQWDEKFLHDFTYKFIIVISITYLITQFLSRTLIE